MCVCMCVCVCVHSNSMVAATYDYLIFRPQQGALSLCRSLPSVKARPRSHNLCPNVSLFLLAGITL